MFEVRFITGDKKLSEVLRLLMGHTLEPPVVIPVKEAMPKHTNGVAKPPPQYSEKIPGGSIGLLRKYIKGRKRVTSGEVRELCAANGYSQTGYSYALKMLVDDGSLKKTKESRVYEVAN